MPYNPPPQAPQNLMARTGQIGLPQQQPRQNAMQGYESLMSSYGDIINMALSNSRKPQQSGMPGAPNIPGQTPQPNLNPLPRDRRKGQGGGGMADLGEIMQLISTLFGAGGMGGGASAGASAGAAPGAGGSSTMFAM